MGNINEAALASKEKQTISMSAGVLNYTLDEVPDDDYEVQCFINGVEVNFTLDGVNLVITEYTAGTIEESWELKVYYFKEN